MIYIVFLMSCISFNVYAGYSTLSDFTYFMESLKYNILEYKEINNSISIALQNKETGKVQAFSCNLEDPWVHPKFYTDLIVEKCFRIPYFEYRIIFDNPVDEELYGF